MAEVKFNVYKLEYEFDKSLFKPCNLKECLDNLDLKKHLYKINEHKGFLDKKAENIFSFQKFRKDFNPIIKNEITGKTRQIDLNENESLLEENYLYWDFKNNMVFFQYNYHGFTPLNFENYIKLFFSNTFKDDFFTLKAVMSKTGYEALVNSNLVKSFELRVAEPSINMLNDLGLSSDAIIKIDDGNIGKIDIKITAGRNKSLLNILSFKKIFPNKNKFDKMKVKVSDSYLKGGNMIDLLEEKYTIVKTVREYKKQINPNDMIITVENVYEEHIKEVLKLV